MIKAHWRSALILAIGLLASSAALSHAVADDQNAPAPTGVTPQADTSTSSPSLQANPATQSSSPAQASPATQSNSATQLTTDDEAAAPGEPQPSGQQPAQADSAAAPQPSAAPSPAPRRQSVAAGSSEYSVWKDTSLIGKIFIGVGALLTIASAAGMFMV